MQTPLLQPADPTLAFRQRTNMTSDQLRDGIADQSFQSQLSRQRESVSDRRAEQATEAISDRSRSDGAQPAEDSRLARPESKADHGASQEDSVKARAPERESDEATASKNHAESDAKSTAAKEPDAHTDGTSKPHKEEQRFDEHEIVPVASQPVVPVIQPEGFREASQAPSIDRSQSNSDTAKVVEPSFVSLQPTDAEGSDGQQPKVDAQDKAQQPMTSAQQSAQTNQQNDSTSKQATVEASSHRRGTNSAPIVADAKASQSGRAANVGQTAPSEGIEKVVQQRAEQGTDSKSDARQEGGRSFFESNARSTSARPAEVRATQVDQSIRLGDAGKVAQMPVSTASHNAGPPTLANANVARGVAVTHMAAARADDLSEAFSSRIVRGLNAMVNHRGGAMTMRLDPPELGQMRVQMTVLQGAVTASFEVENEQAHTLLRHNLATLRQSLEGQGLTADRLTVHLAHSSSESSNANSGRSNDQTQHEHEQANAGEGESRGRREESPRDDAQQRSSQRHAFAGTLSQAAS